MKKIFVVIIFIAISSTILFGCSSKVEKSIPVDIPKEWSDNSKVSDLKVTFYLLDMIKDEKIAALVKEAMVNNHDLKATILRLKAANFLVNGSRSVFMPSVNAQISKEKNNHNLDDNTGKRTKQYQYKAALNISWEIDIWGKLSDEYNAEKAELSVLKEEYLSARDSLATRVIQSFINVIATKKAIIIGRERLDTLKKNDINTLRRYKKGLGRLDELSASKSKREVAKAGLSSKIEAHKRALRALGLLLGRYPEGVIDAHQELPEIKSPPLFIPAVTLRNRPDIKAAIANIEAGNFKVLASKKGFLPSVQITSDMLKDSFRGGSLDSATLLWNVVFSLIQPVFNGGKIYYQKKASELQRDASVQDLAQKVLGAIKEVQDALGYEIDYSQQVRFLENALKESTKSRIYYESRYRKGLDTIQTLLIAQEEEMNLKAQLNEIKAALLNNRIELALTTGIGTEKSNMRDEL
jgi:outer membrane protein TolC